MRFRSRRHSKLKVILATSRVLPVRQVLEALAVEAHLDLAVHEARSTDGVYRLATDAHLVILDPADVAEGETSRQALVKILRQCQTPLAASAEFLAEPATWWARAGEATGAVQHLPPRRVAITTYAGGVGKTTLALDTAVRFAACTRLPVLVLEFVQGASALRSLIDPGLPDLYDCLTEGRAPGTWRDAALLPLVMDVARYLDREALRRYLADLVRQYVLVLADVSHYPHPLFGAFDDLVEQYLLVSVPGRPDTVSNATLLHQELNGHRPVCQVWNMAGRVDRLLAAGLARDLDLPVVAYPGRFEGRLGQRVLPLIYPHSIW